MWSSGQALRLSVCVCVCVWVCACACALTQTGTFKNLSMISAAFGAAFMACAIKISGFISPPRSSGAKTAKCTAEIKLQRKERREQQNYMQNKIGNCRGNTQHGRKSSAIATWRVSRRKLIFLLHNFASGWQREREGERESVWKWARAMHIACTFSRWPKKFLAIVFL